MGSECILNLHDADTALAKAAEDEIFRIERRYSRYRADSILADINRASAMGGSIEVDEETASLLDYAFACHRKSRGLFDITTGALRRVWNFPGSKVPEAAAIERLLAVVGLEKVIWSRPLLSFPLAGVELDFGGICKEYAADRAAAICSEGGVASGFVNLGGDISVIGPRPDGTPWPIKIRDPRATDKSHAVIHLSKGGLATSGDYERCITFGGKRYSHILNPRTGWPSSGLFERQHRRGNMSVSRKCRVARYADGPRWTRLAFRARRCPPLDRRRGRRWRFGILQSNQILD